MTNFQHVLKSLVESVPHALGAIFADWEGEAVDQFSYLPVFDIQLIGAHCGIVFNNAAAQLRHWGDVEEMLFQSESVLLLIRKVTPQYFVVLATRPNAQLAYTRRALQKGVSELFRLM